jgi:hypothetical protein
MGDFVYKKHISGLTIELVKITLAGTVEAGDIIAYDRTKADADDVAPAWLAYEAGDATDEILALPLVPGVILEGVADGDIASKGLACSLIIDTATQKVDADAGAGYPYFLALSTVDVLESDTDKVLVMFNPVPYNGALALAGANP